jgi:hypothetical protein
VEEQHLRRMSGTVDRFQQYGVAGPQETPAARFKRGAKRSSAAGRQRCCTRRPMS